MTELALLVREMFDAETASKAADDALVDANDRADSLYSTSLRFPHDQVIAGLRAQNLSDCAVLTGVRSEARRRLSDARAAVKAAIAASPAPMPTIQVGDVVVSTRDPFPRMTSEERHAAYLNGEGAPDVVAIYRDPLWRRPAPMPTKGDE